jgi:hypothetical protein
MREVVAGIVGGVFAIYLLAAGAPAIIAMCLGTLAVVGVLYLEAAR